MSTDPGTIDLGKFRVVYQEERERPSDGADGYFLQQRAIIRLNEELVKLEQQEDYTIYCDEENFKKQVGKLPLPAAISHRFDRLLHVQPIEAICFEGANTH